jgi:hypothetical protein
MIEVALVLSTILAKPRNTRCFRYDPPYELGQSPFSHLDTLIKQLESDSRQCLICPSHAETRWLLRHLGFLLRLVQFSLFPNIDIALLPLGGHQAIELLEAFQESICFRHEYRPISSCPNPDRAYKAEADPWRCPEKQTKDICFVIPRQLASHVLQRAVGKEP